jgi:hypothetical protein
MSKQIFNAFKIKNRSTLETLLTEYLHDPLFCDSSQQYDFDIHYTSEIAGFIYNVRFKGMENQILTAYDNPIKINIEICYEMERDNHPRFLIGNAFHFFIGSWRDVYYCICQYITYYLDYLEKKLYDID